MRSPRRGSVPASAPSGGHRPPLLDHPGVRVGAVDAAHGDDALVAVAVAFAFDALDRPAGDALAKGSGEGVGRVDDIRNGDLGAIVEVFDAPAEDGSGGWMDIDGRAIPLTVDVFSSLALGYAVTVHKSQGSQWPVCLLMLPAHAVHMTDRTLLYTAATRATEQLVLCGARRLLDRAVRNGSNPSVRRANLAQNVNNHPQGGEVQTSFFTPSATGIPQFVRN